MPKPIVSIATKKIQGENIPFFRVSFPNAKRIIMILDDRNNMVHEDDRDTFINLCNKVCRVQRESYTFVYTTAGKNGKTNITRLLEEHTPEVVVFASDVFNTFFYRDEAPFFGRLARSKIYGVKTILTIPFYKWANLTDRKKNKEGAHLFGFILKHLVTAAEGKNIFSLSKKEIPPKAKVRIINTIEKFDKFMLKLEKAPEVAIDSETDNLARVTNKILTWQFAFNAEVGYVLPVEHRETPWSEKDFIYIKKRIKRYIETTTAIHIYHFSQFDIGQMLVWLDLPYYPVRVFDTIGGLYGIDENQKRLKNLSGVKKPYSLETLEAMMGIKRIDISIDKEDRSNMAKFSLADIAEYGVADVVNLFPIKKKMLEICTHPLIGYKSAEDFERLVIKQLGVMSKVFTYVQNNGMHIDTEYVFSLVQPGNQFEQTIKKTYAEIAATPEGKKTNALLMKRKGLASKGLFAKSKNPVMLDLGKPDHRQALFFDVMELEPIRMGKNGKGSTDKAFQKAYKDKHPIVKQYEHLNKINKLKSSFADAVAARIVSDPDFLFDNRLRSSYGYSNVDSGRSSSWDLNQQQVPSQGDLAKIIKKEFRVAHGRIMGAADFSAHEVRMSGVIADDPVVREVFTMANKAIINYRLALEDVLEKATKILAEEGDIHIQNVWLFFNKKVDKKHVLRYQIKAIVFGTLYGKMAKGLSKELGITAEEAQALIDVLFERWENVASWINETHQQGKKTQMVRYPNNRIRHVWAYLSSDIWVERAMDRISVNAPIQGFSSDIGIVAVDEFNRWKYENCYKRGLNFDVLSINIVHDAQYWDSSFACLPLTLYLTEHAMSTLPMDYYEKEFDYPLTTALSYGVEFGRSWDEMEEWNMRLTMPEKTDDLGKMGLYDRIRDYGKDQKLEYDSVIKDAKKIYKVRTKELETNPYKMKLRGNRLPEFLEGLNMFKKEDA